LSWRLAATTALLQLVLAKKEFCALVENYLEELGMELAPVHSVTCHP